ncbi:endopeptidase La [Noviherbaspirillum sp. CPCC 100848]|uniref:Lon protease n=1 Tax=Noviherbaspirillum album TaxID=3080276 RepID=A0ABU6J680_9BURK|nr:endopeptidase La [Noviherbaspirillum sp. CPCC 100848]MEC4718938.1 endopeptidase La [Noviherbaspirillum sp. CPCC 100848]
MDRIKAEPSKLPALPPDAMIIIPVRYLVLFPGMIVPISVGRESSIAAAQEAVRGEHEIGLLLQHDSEHEAPTADQLYQVGTVASVLRYLTSDEGGHYIVCQGQQRFRIIEFLDGYPFYVARIERIAGSTEQGTEIEARLHQLKQLSTEIIDLLPQAPPELAAAAQNMTSAAELADFVCGLMDLPLVQKQQILETRDLVPRLDHVISHLAERIEVLRLSEEIHAQTKERMEDRQREFLLREQLKTIQHELGETEAGDAEAEKLAEAIGRAGMPPEVEAHVRKELQRLRRMPEAAAEYSMLCTYLEWMTELPWSKRSDDRIDIAEARRILDEDHFGLDKVKRRILEYLAVRKLNPEGRSPILCFVGPPGVGKTSLGQSIARATGRKFARVSLGGVHDEAEVRGHRRTYVGALPGNIIQALRKAGTHNCVMMLDEMDKLGSGGMHGDPSAALLEVLDPEQNNSFRDNYLAQPFDLSKVMFIGTANMLDTIPGPLLDRMEVLQLPGYTTEEKAQIARRYVIPRQLEADGITPQHCELSDAALDVLIRDYTREAGVRSLEREIGNVFRHVAMRIAEGEGGTEALRIEAGDLAEILGPKKYESELAMRTSLPGVATGLAWTAAGGEILFIEASRTPGSGKLILTGQLGDVMKESAQAALTLVKAHCAELQIDADLFEKQDIHVHVPAGAMPKDGPSAGVAIFVALTSLVRDRPVASDCAMTGEISLRGMVLPVGGIKEKVLAALQAGIKVVMLPARNRKDIDDIPEAAKQQLRFVWLDTVDEALHEAIGNLIIDDLA